MGLLAPRLLAGCARAADARLERGSARGLVALAVFKTVAPCRRGTGGGFDSHALPPLFVRGGPRPLHHPPGRSRPPEPPGSPRQSRASPPPEARSDIHLPPQPFTPRGARSCLRWRGGLRMRRSRPRGWRRRGRTPPAERASLRTTDHGPRTTVVSEFGARSPVPCLCRPPATPLRTTTHDPRATVFPVLPSPA